VKTILPRRSARRTHAIPTSGNRLCDVSTVQFAGVTAGEEMALRP